MKKETITIARIKGEYLDAERNCSEYITPYTGYDHFHWFTLEDAKQIFDKLDFNCLTKQDKDLLPEYKMTKTQLELHIVEHFELGDKPHLYLFGFTIPKHIWDNKEIFAADSGYSDDVMSYINDYVNYRCKLVEEKIIEIPKTILKKHHSIAA